ncbi:hypothetical protein BOX15_Mlig021284g2 [Macrostomum lignano]|uniref:Pancreatic hormone n=3 Tax=Macrostomum lignano TaxID=282301 RepID=A0A1I8G5Z9_9PLAT|nr:hypothetical protein BOX15_Mlig021284g2 [Macrostomum lignano]
MPVVTAHTKALILLGLVHLLVLLQASGGAASPASEEAPVGKREQQPPLEKPSWIKEYLQNLRGYMTLIARPRFGKRPDTP